MDIVDLIDEVFDICADIKSLKCQFEMYIAALDSPGYCIDDDTKKRFCGVRIVSLMGLMTI